MKTKIGQIINRPISIAPLISFRVLFGFIMLASVLRFVWKGWIETQYLAPEFHFTYYGFGWVQPLGVWGMYLLFGVMAISALGIMLGYYYRLNALAFFLAFTYVELIDKTNYLNHYYFVSLMAFILIFLPVNRFLSLDAQKQPSIQTLKIPYGFVLILQLMLSLVYFYAGLAKLHPDWLFEALPLRIWLPPLSHLPFIGGLMDELWVAYAFSWFGAFYDLTIPFFLFFRKTRPFAFLAVIVFHISTWILFPIGMFPFIMILATTIFFAPETHEKIVFKIKGLLEKWQVITPKPLYLKPYHFPNKKYLWAFFALFLTIQVLLPWRFLLYPGHLFWTEQGYRFSWRVMLMEKAGYAIFHLKDKNTGKEWNAYAGDYLTPMQEKQMATQPDMILQFVHFLEEKMEEQGYKDIEIRAEAYVTLNGRGNRMFIDPQVDLTQEKESFQHKSWILPYSE